MDSCSIYASNVQACCSFQHQQACGTWLSSSCLAANIATLSTRTCPCYSKPTLSPGSRQSEQVRATLSPFLDANRLYSADSSSSSTWCRSSSLFTLIVGTCSWKRLSNPLQPVHAAPPLRTKATRFLQPITWTPAVLSQYPGTEDGIFQLVQTQFTPVVIRNLLPNAALLSTKLNAANQL